MVDIIIDSETVRKYLVIFSMTLFLFTLGAFATLKLKQDRYALVDTAKHKQLGHWASVCLFLSIIGFSLCIAGVISQFSNSLPASTKDIKTLYSLYNIASHDTQAQFNAAFEQSMKDSEISIKESKALLMLIKKKPEYLTFDEAESQHKDALEELQKAVENNKVKRKTNTFDATTMIKINTILDDIKKPDQDKITSAYERHYKLLTVSYILLAKTAAEY